MTPRDLPLVEVVLEAGAKDGVYDALLLIAPVVIAIVITAGRSAVTVGIVVAYLVVFVSYVIYNGIR